VIKSITAGGGIGRLAHNGRTCPSRLSSVQKKRPKPRYHRKWSNIPEPLVTVSKSAFGPRRGHQRRIIGDCKRRGNLYGLRYRSTSKQKGCENPGELKGQDPGKSRRAVVALANTAARQLGGKTTHARKIAILESDRARSTTIKRKGSGEEPARGSLKKPRRRKHDVVGREKNTKRMPIKAQKKLKTAT